MFDCQIQCRPTATIYELTAKRELRFSFLTSHDIALSDSALYVTGYAFDIAAQMGATVALHSSTLALPLVDIVPPSANISIGTVLTASTLRVAVVDMSTFSETMSNDVNLHSSILRVAVVDTYSSAPRFIANGLTLMASILE